MDVHLSKYIISLRFNLFLSTFHRFFFSYFTFLSVKFSLSRSLFLPLCFLLSFFIILSFSSAIFYLFFFKFFSTFSFNLLLLPHPPSRTRTQFSRLYLSFLSVFSFFHFSFTISYVLNQVL